MKVDVTIKNLTNAQVSAALLLIPVSESAPVSWRVSNWSYGDGHAHLELNGIEDAALHAIFFELKERTIVLTSTRKSREHTGY